MGSVPAGRLPKTKLLAAPDRLGLLREPMPGELDMSPAEVVIGWLQARIRRGDHDAIVLIEEPELDLNPQAQRYLYRVMRGFAERNQGIYSTRSASFVDAVHHEEIVRLDISGSGLAVRHAPTELMSDEQRLRLAAEFNHERGEMFFANSVVLVEGQTEAQVLPIIFRSMGYDPDAMGIAITEVGGKGNLILVARVLAELNIPHLIVHDSDRGRPGAAENAKIAAAIGRTPRIQLDPDFEGAAGIHRRKDKVLRAYLRFANAPVERIPAPFQRIVRTAVRLAKRPPAR
jgi:predicted ATP-dependent endonuclease of OLD family